MNSSEIVNLKKRLTLISETVSNEIYNLGDSFFENIVLKLNEALDADYTYIGVFNEDVTATNTLSAATKEGLIDNFSYLLKDTPCEKVLTQSPCTFPKDVNKLFPKAQKLINLGIEAYTAIPLYNSKGEHTGILTCMFKKPIEDLHVYESLLLIFASRAGAEIEHKKLYSILARNKKELEHKVQDRTKELRQKNNELEVANKEMQVLISKLSEAQNKLIQSEKMASLGILTAGVAHEINNPLNFIYGGYTGLKNYFDANDKTSNDEITFFLDSINTGVERATKIIDSLGQFSRITDSFKEKCDIHKILDDCLVMLDIGIKGRIVLKKEYTSSKAIIAGNSGKLHQVFLNILNNSIQAIEGQGEIVVQTKCDNSNVQIIITDSGHGIREDDISKILNPFYTTKQVGEGTGLGLSITFSILKEHKGSIAFDSKENEYTKAIVKLPVNPD